MTAAREHRIGELGVWPLLIICAASCIALGSTPPPSLQPVQSGSSWDRIIFFGGPYLLAFFLALPRIRTVTMLARRAWVYLVITALVLVSALWSVAPEKVATNFVHMVGLFLVCSAAAQYAVTRPEGFFGKVQIVFALILLASVAVVFLAPNIGLEERINIWTPPSGRWKGITHHPNTLGAVGTIAGCVSLAVYTLTKSRFRKFLSLAIIALSLVVTSVGSRSMTSTLSLLPVVLGYPVLMGMRNDSRAKVWLKLIAIGFLGLLLLLGVLLFKPEALGVDALFKAIGRDPTLTGRTQLWALAFSLIEQKPFLGWSFDSLASVLKNSYGAMPYGQFHNGYIDLMVRGGAVGVFLLSIMIVRAVRMGLRQLSTDYAKGMGVIALFLVVIVSNFAEATFVAEGSAHWFLFVACWLTAELTAALAAPKPAPIPPWPQREGEGGRRP